MEKITIFNPQDKINEKTRFYLGYVPKELKTIVKKIVNMIMNYLDGIQRMKIIK